MILGYVAMLHQLYLFRQYDSLLIFEICFMNEDIFCNVIKVRSPYTSVKKIEFNQYEVLYDIPSCMYLC